MIMIMINCVLSNTAIYDAANREVFPLLRHNVVIKRAAQFLLFWLSEGGLGEHHLLVRVDLHATRLTQRARQALLQGEELTQRIQWETTVPAAVAVAVNEQQVLPARRYVTV